MSPRNSLLKRAIVPLLAVAAAASLCTPAHAATASWAYCQGQSNQDGTKQVNEQVQCVVEQENMWDMDVMHNNRLGGGDDNTAQSSLLGDVGPGDFYDPVDGQYPNPVHSTGTYNCWCICSGYYYEGPNGGQNWDVSTGGTKYVTF